MKSGALGAVLLVLVAACGDGAAAPGTSTTPAATTAPTTGGVPPTAADPTPTTVAPTTPTTAAATTTTVDPNAPVVVAMSFVGGEVKGPDRVEVDKGDMVTLGVTSDVAEEVHIHGYDLFTNVAAGGSATLEFEASIQGIFEIELEESRTELTELVVN